MTDKLTPEQRKRVAEATTGNSYMIITTGPNGGGMPLIAEEINPDDPGALWKPHKKSDHWKALVTWLSTRMYRADGQHHRATAKTLLFNDFPTLMRFLVAISKNDTDDLESMAYELLEVEDGSI